MKKIYSTPEITVIDLKDVVTIDVSENATYANKGGFYNDFGDFK